MKLVSYTWGRENGTYVTDLTPMDFVRWYTQEVGRGVVILSMFDITPAEAQRWNAEGGKTILRRDSGL